MRFKLESLGVDCHSTVQQETTHKSLDSAKLASFLQTMWFFYLLIFVVQPDCWPTGLCEGFGEFSRVCSLAVPGRTDNTEQLTPGAFMDFKCVSVCISFCLVKAKTEPVHSFKSPGAHNQLWEKFGRAGIQDQCFAHWCYFFTHSLSLSQTENKQCWRSTEAAHSKIHPEWQVLEGKLYTGHRLKYESTWPFQNHTILWIQERKVVFPFQFLLLLLVWNCERQRQRRCTMFLLQCGFKYRNRDILELVLLGKDVHVKRYMRSFCITSMSYHQNFVHKESRKTVQKDEKECHPHVSATGSCIFMSYPCTKSTQYIYVLPQHATRLVELLCGATAGSKELGLCSFCFQHKMKFCVLYVFRKWTHSWEDYWGQTQRIVTLWSFLFCLGNYSDNFRRLTGWPPHWEPIWLSTCCLFHCSRAKTSFWMFCWKKCNIYWWHGRRDLSDSLMKSNEHEQSILFCCSISGRGWCFNAPCSFCGTQNDKHANQSLVLSHVPWSQV